MKSVVGMIVVFIGLYIIAYSDIMGFFAQKTLYYTALGCVCIALEMAAAFLGTPFTKPLFKRRGDDNDKTSHLH